MSEEELYAGREQTLVKHYILRSYLDRFAHIVGSSWGAITYIDCFSGPWNVQSSDLRDASFYIAVEELRKARSHLHDRRGKDFAIRCFFLERDAEAFRQLETFAASAHDIEIAIRNATLEESIGDIVSFVKERTNDAFTFIFVDPTGWTGFAMHIIHPLLELWPGEALVNFMTSHILRFAEHPDESVRKSFDRLFGDIDFRRRIEGLMGVDREEELVRCYGDAVRLAGRFDYVCPAIVLHPQRDRTHYHLLYATRNARGVEVFKEVEKKAMKVMENARGQAQQRKRQAKDGQLEMFEAADMHDPAYYNQLRERYLREAERCVEQLLHDQGTVEYDTAWVSSLSYPLVWESDLKEWVQKWSRSGQLVVEGLTGRERVPKRGKNHRLVWKGDIG